MNCQLVHCVVVMMSGFLCFLCFTSRKRILNYHWLANDICCKMSNDATEDV